MSTTMTSPFGRVGKRVEIFEAFYDAKARTRKHLEDAGVDPAVIARFDAPKMQSGESLSYLAEALHDAGVDDVSATVQLREAAGVGEPTTVTEHEALLLESGSTSDFGSYLSNLATKRFMGGYQQAPSRWKQITRTYSVPDFKPLSFVGLSEMEDFLPVPEGGPVLDSQVDEIPGPTVQVQPFARSFSLSRQALVNDDLNQLRERPAALGRAYARTLNKRVVGQLVANPNAYDGNAVFSVGHANLISGLFSGDNVGKLISGLSTARDHNGEIIGLEPYALVVPPQLRLQAEVLRQSATIPQPGTGVGGANVVGGMIPNLIVEPQLAADPDDYYVVADPNAHPGLGVAYLNGKEQPDIFIKDPGMRNVLGGSDPYDMVLQEIEWMGRGDFAVTIVDWRPLQKAAN